MRTAAPRADGTGLRSLPQPHAFRIPDLMGRKEEQRPSHPRDPRPRLSHPVNPLAVQAFLASRAELPRPRVRNVNGPRQREVPNGTPVAGLWSDVECTANKHGGP